MTESAGVIFQRFTDEGEAVVVSNPPPGVEKYFYSPNLCDPCSWWEGSGVVSDETLTDQGAHTVYTSANTNWIDLRHGRMFQEDSILAENPTLGVLVEISTNSGSSWDAVYENTWGETDGDYTVDYEAGSITFNSAQDASTLVRASYAYAQDFAFTVSAAEGKRTKLGYVELQFTTDVEINTDIVFEIWAYNPADLPNKVLYKQEHYKKAQDFMQESTGPFPVTPAWGGATRGFSHDIITIPFNYMAYRSIKSSEGTEIRVKLGSGSTPLVGEWATATFYATTEDET